MTILAGKATLDLYPRVPWLDESKMPRAAYLVASVEALAMAHAHIMAIRVNYGDPPISVEVAIPSDGSLDLAELQRELTARVTAALVEARSRYAAALTSSSVASAASTSSATDHR